MKNRNKYFYFILPTIFSLFYTIFINYYMLRIDFVVCFIFFFLYWTFSFMLLTSFSKLIKKLSLSPKLDICIILSCISGLLWISFVLVAITTKYMFFIMIAFFSFVLCVLFAFIGHFIEKLSNIQEWSILHTNTPIREDSNWVLSYYCTSDKL